MSDITLEVSIPGEAPYDVHIGQDLLADVGAKLGALPQLARTKKVYIISDTNVAPLYVAPVQNSLEHAGYTVEVHVVPAGEASKSIATLAQTWESMAACGLSRDACVLALGGGVVGDLAGFAASTYMRGVACVQVPTTLLAMVDSSVGGKTAVNLEAGKNLVGTFTQPLYVCASTNTLLTLNEREWACGCAEVAKSALIDSRAFFDWLEASADAMAAREQTVVAEALARCVQFKAGVVAADKTESAGIRECLNYGHTLAHAIEVLAGYGTFSHGAAVAEGMRFAARLGEKLVGTPHEVVKRQDALLDALGLPALAWRASYEQMFDCMKRDKKVRAGSIRFVLLRDVGQWEVVAVEDEIVLQALREWEQA